MKKRKQPKMMRLPTFDERLQQAVNWYSYRIEPPQEAELQKMSARARRRLSEQRWQKWYSDPLNKKAYAEIEQTGKLVTEVGIDDHQEWWQKLTTKH